jgi:hypothetical protein
VTCTALYPSLSTVLIWVTRLFDTSSTVTGMESPSLVKMRIMPTLRPTRPRLIVISNPGYDWPGVESARPEGHRRFCPPDWSGLAFQTIRNPASPDPEKL